MPSPLTDRRGTIHPEPGIDEVVEKIDDQVDRHEQGGHQDQIGPHDGDIHARHGLQKHVAHPRPLEDRLGDDRVGDDLADLEARDRDDRNQGVLEGMAEMERPVGQPPGPGELDVVGPEHLEHLGADEAHDEGHLEEAERDRRQDQRLEAASRQESRRPPAEPDDLAPPLGGKPAEDHGKQIDQEDPDQKGRQGNPDQRHRLEQPAQRSPRG